MFSLHRNVFVAQAAGLWLAPLPVARGGILGTGGVRERERTRTEHPTPKKQRRREPVWEKIIACNSVLEARWSGDRSSRSQRNAAGGFSFSLFISVHIVRVKL